MKRKIINKKPELGVTLLALVITIIVLIILAGVTLNTLMGEGGIIARAQLAKEETDKNNTLEKLIIVATSAFLSGNGKIEDDELLKNELTSEFGAGNYTIEGDATNGWTVKIGKYEYKIYENGKVELSTTSSNSDENEPENTVAGKYYANDTKVIVNGKELTIPGGATLSGKTGEYENVENGIVIYMTKQEVTGIDWTSSTVQTTYDQFVWVPVDNPVVTDKNADNNIDATDIDKMIEAEEYPMAIEIDGKDTAGNQNYRAVLYDFTLSSDGTKVNITDKDWTTETTDYVEPKSLSDDITSIQQDYNLMVSRVISEGGFWVGRYETSNLYDTANIVNIVKGTTTDLSIVTWSGMYSKQKLYISASGLGEKTSNTSSMIWGSQWDQIMIWMRTKKNTSQNSFYIIDSRGMGNYHVSDIDDGYSSDSEPAATGCFEVYNIYDLAGNLYEWTLEASGSNNRVMRGGAYSSSNAGFSAGYRNAKAENTTADLYIKHIGTRMTLY